jgi:hypothetical protein
MSAPPNELPPPTKAVDDCPHSRTTTRVEVFTARNTTQAQADGTVTGTYFVAEVRINCMDCSVPFQWVHPIHGSFPDQVALSADGLTLRAPMVPHGH